MAHGLCHRVTARTQLLAGAGRTAAKGSQRRTLGSATGPTVVRADAELGPCRRADLLWSPEDMPATPKPQMLIADIETIRDLRVDVDIPSMLDRIDDRYRWPVRYHDGQPTVEVLLEDGSKTDSLFSPLDGYVIPELVRDHYHQGRTLIISRVETLFATVRDLTRRLEQCCDHPVTINAYLGTGTSTVSFKPHSHDYAVLVKNLQGQSIWQVDAELITVRDQDVLYLPKGTVHEVLSIVLPKLSLTCNLG